MVLKVCAINKRLLCVRQKLHRKKTLETTFIMQIPRNSKYVFVWFYERQSIKYVLLGPKRKCDRGAWLYCLVGCRKYHWQFKVLNLWCFYFLLAPQIIPLRGNSGRFRSPGFSSGSYPPNLDITWTVSGRTVRGLLLEFLTIDTERGYVLGRIYVGKRIMLRRWITYLRCILRLGKYGKYDALIVRRS